MDLGLRDKVAIVTGSSRGIGRAIALGLAEEGCHVVLCARGEERLREAEGEARARGVRALGVVADMNELADVERLVSEAASAFGRIDILVNSVGGSWAGEEDEAWDAAYRANILAAAPGKRLGGPRLAGAGRGRPKPK